MLMGCCAASYDWEAGIKLAHRMRKAMEFPTEWTMSDPGEDSDLSSDDYAGSSSQVEAAAPEENAMMAEGVISAENTWPHCPGRTS